MAMGSIAYDAENAHWRYRLDDDDPDEDQIPKAQGAPELYSGWAGLV